MIKKMASFQITHELIKQMFQFPDDAEIVRIDLMPETRGTMLVTVEGIGWDTPEGGNIMRTSPTVTTKERETFIDWSV